MMAVAIPMSEISDLKFLRAGAFGEVSVGKFKGETVAVKRLIPVAQKKNYKKEFDYIDMLQSLRHSNIIKFIGITVGDSFYNIVMEYCPNGSLKDVLHSPETTIQLTPQLRIEWAIQIASGMDYLHSLNPAIIHRDLKPPNILVNAARLLKISDFGEFREWANQDSTRMTHCGTTEYMAPEMIRGDKCGQKVDVWSYGVVLWEMYTRETPYKSLDRYAVFWNVGNNKLKLDPPATAPDELKFLLQQCWAQSSGDRPSFRDILSRLAPLSVPATTSSMGTQFFIAFPWAPFIGARYIVLSNGNTVSTDVQVMSSFRGFKDVSLVIPPMSTRKIDFPIEIDAQSGDNLFTREQKGISVNSKEPIIVTVVGVYFVRDALLAFPSSALGTLYYPITAWRGEHKYERCQVIAVGTEDSTRVTFTVGSEVKKSEINQLDIQTLSLKGKDLTGTRVESNKPIALYSAWNRSNPYYDVSMCASIPVYALGDRFPVASLLPEERKDYTVYIKIVAVESDTGVFVDGKQKTVIHNQGQSYSYEIPSGSSHLLTTSKPAAVAQETHGGYRVSISNVASDTQFIKGKHLFRTVWEEDNDDLPHYIVIITYKGKEDEMEVDGERIRGKWTEIGGSEFSFITVPLKRGQHSLDCTDPTKLYTATLVEHHPIYVNWISSRLVGVTLKNGDMD